MRGMIAKCACGKDNENGPTVPKASQTVGLRRAHESSTTLLDHGVAVHVALGDVIYVHRERDADTWHEEHAWVVDG